MLGGVVETSIAIHLGCNSSFIAPSRADFSVNFMLLKSLLVAHTFVFMFGGHVFCVTFSILKALCPLFICPVYDSYAWCLFHHVSENTKTLYYIVFPHTHHYHSVIITAYGNGSCCCIKRVIFFALGVRMCQCLSTECWVWRMSCKKNCVFFIADFRCLQRMIFTGTFIPRWSSMKLRPV